MSYSADQAKQDAQAAPDALASIIKCIQQLAAKGETRTNACPFNAQQKADLEALGYVVQDDWIIWE